MFKVESQGKIVKGKEYKAKPLSTERNYPELPFAGTPVDIIIPYHGQYASVRELVDSIHRCTKNNPYIITLVDDGSKNASFGEILKQLPRVKVVRSPEHKGFGEALRLGFSATENPWVVFMNSDCLVEDGKWLLELGESMQKLKSKGVKMVSAKIDNPTGGDPKVKAEKYDRGDDVIINEFLPLHCVMCHRDLFRRIGGFIKPYPYGFFEDEELSFRMKKRGFLQAVSGGSWVKHYGGLTIQELWKEDSRIKDIMFGNRDLCLRDIKNLV